MTAISTRRFQKVNKGLAEMRADGSYDLIFAERSSPVTRRRSSAACG